MRGMHICTCSIYLGLHLLENQVQHSKECEILVQKQHYYFTFTLYLYMVPLKSMGIHMARYAHMRAGHM
jgi:hypothetical protein